MAAFDADSIMDSIKKALPGWLSDFLSSTVSSFTGGWGWLLDKIGFGPEKIKEGLDFVTKKAIEGTNANLATAQTAIETNLASDKILKPIQAKFGFAADSKFMAGLKPLIAASGHGFMETSVPELEDGYATAAVSAASKLHTEIVDYAFGKDGKLGALLAENPKLTPAQRKQMAESIATYLTGVPADADVSVAITLPENGMVAMFAKAQLALNNPKLAKDALKAKDIPLTLDEAALTAPAIAKAKAAADDATAATKKTVTTDGKDVKEPATPAAIAMKKVQSTVGFN